MGSIMILTQPTGRGTAGQSFQNTATVVAPASGNSIVAVSGAGIIPGIYLVEAWVSFTAGAPAAADVANMKIIASSPLVNYLTINIPAVLNLVVYVSQIIRVTVETNIGVSAVGNATAGVNYTAALEVTRIG